MSSGPLSGVRVIEFAGIGPAPFCAMLLSDMGAEVLRIDRPDAGATAHEVPARGRRSLALDLKSAASTELCLKAIEKADVLIEGFRPGVMERLGLGPDPALQRNPRLIYGRMTGWGQSGPLAYCAEQDIARYARGREFPIIPCNLCGSQENMKRREIKAMLAGWEQQDPGRTDRLFRSLQNVAPSHLADRDLFDFESLGVGSDD